MAPLYSIRVQHGHHLEDKVLTQHSGTKVVRIEDEFEETVEYITGGGFPWMDSASYEHYLKYDLNHIIICYGVHTYASSSKLIHHYIIHTCTCVHVHV